MTTLLLLMMTALAGPGGAPANKAPHILRVKSTVARLRAAPDKKAAVVILLPMGAELQRLGRVGSFFEVKSADKKIGYVSSSLVQSQTLPTPAQYREQLSALNELGLQKKVRRLLERQVAQFPLSLAAIEAYEAHVAKSVSETSLKKARARKTKFKSSDFGKSGAAKLYFLRKGWVAAKRKSLSPAGPLYPIVDGLAILPLGCDAGAKANGARSPKDIPNLELRARATEIASSGKVVSVSEGGYKTQKLNRPLCKDGHLAYKMKGAKNGALVPSWLVAGYKVTPFVGNPLKAYKAESALARAEYRAGQMVIGTLSKRMETRVPSSWIPVALLTVQSGQADVIYRVPQAEGCDGPFFYLENYDFWAEVRSEGIRYSSGLEGECAATQFEQLSGEPRDIGVKVMLSDDWAL